MPITLQVLVVDDDPGMRSGVARALKHYSAQIPEVEEDVCFQVEQAASGKEALETIDTLNPALLFLDYKLPDMTGFDIMEQVVPESSERMIIMMTAYASIETAIRATKHGAYDFLAKPFTPEELRKTARKAAEQVIYKIRAKQLAEEKRQVRFQFISVLSHELKTPLSVVEGYLNLIKNRSAGEEITAYDQIVERSIFRLEQMRKLIYDLLDLTRIESGQKARNVQETDIIPIAQRTLEDNRPAAKKRHISLTLEADKSCSLPADPNEMEIIFNNLISNAIKYNKENGRVDIAIQKVEGEKGGVEITVKDTGIGMTEEEQNKLFHDFVRIRNEQTKDILGSGLGLSTVKKLVQLYQGEIQVNSQPGEGSTFTVFLPSQGETRET